jgi:uncharacterized HAD superfamily protein
VPKNKQIFSVFAHLCTYYFELIYPQITQINTDLSLKMLDFKMLQSRKRLKISKIRANLCNLWINQVAIKNEEK